MAFSQKKLQGHVGYQAVTQLTAIAYTAQPAEKIAYKGRLWTYCRAAIFSDQSDPRTQWRF